MLMALIILAAMLTFGLLFSGWLTPLPSKAQQGTETNSPPSQEDTDCVTASTSSSCVSAGSVSLVEPVNSPVVCIGSSVSLSASYLATAGQVLVTTTYTNANPDSTNSCDDTYSTNYPTPTIVSNWWSASVGSFSTNGQGLTASFTPTDCGNGSVTFHLTYQNSDPCDTNIQSAGDVNGSFTVLALNIIGGGNPISSANGNDAAIVGQHIGLTAQTCGGTFSNFQWSVSGYAISSYDVSSATLVENFSLTNSSVSFYWVSGGSKTITCSAMCGGVTCSTNATISVTRPTVSMHDSNTGIWYAQGYAFWIIGLTFGDPNTQADDMEFHVEIDSPTSGYGEIVQVINSYTLNSVLKASNEADNVVPYNGSFFLPAGGGANALLELDDGPGATGTSVRLTASYIDYVMYQPRIQNTVFEPLGDDATFVPLGKVTWAIDGGAYWSGLSIIIS